MRKVQVGIDLGTTNTLVSCRIKGKLKLIKFNGSTMLPSVIYVEKQDDGSIREIVGKLARKKGIQDPDNYIASSKTYIGLTGEHKKTWTCHGRTYTPTDVATKILEEVHKKVRSTYDLEDDDIVQAVITIPAYFTSAQSDETKRAGERAGMEVIQIITEPVAAAFSVAEEVKGKIFVVDLGGGTFDVSVLELGEEDRTLEVGGERKLGGDDFDDILVKKFLTYIEEQLGINLQTLEESGLSRLEYYLMMSKIRMAAIETKEELSDNEEYEINIPSLFEYAEDKYYNFSRIITREEFEQMCKPLFDRILKVIDDVVKKSKKFKKEELKKIFLVGGSCYISKIQKDIEEYFHMVTDAEQDRAIQVVMGAGKIADAWNGMTDSPWKDIISHDMGIEIINDYQKREFSKLLSKGDGYPCEVRGSYKTAYDNQTSVVIKVYEKTDRSASDFIEKNESAFDLYGSFELSGIIPAPAGKTPIEVTFNYDKSRTLKVTAKDTKNNIKQEVILHKGELLKDTTSTNVQEATDFYLLLDVSGSMYGNRIKAAKKACKKLIQETLDLSVHKLGLISFGNFAHVVCELTQDRGALMVGLEQIEVNGSTEMATAIRNATNRLKKSKNRKALIIVTDGEPNSKSETSEEAKKAKELGISIATIGVQNSEMNYLGNLSSDKNLTYNVNNIDSMSEVFGKAVENLLRK